MFSVFILSRFVRASFSGHT